MKVWQVMQKNPLTVSPETTFSQAWDLLFKKHRHSLPVTEKNNHLVGIVGIEDVMKQLYPSYSDTLEEFLKESTFDDLEDKIDELKSRKVEKFMNKSVTCVFRDDPVLKALSKMVVKRVRQLPVIDYDEKLIGILSKRDIFDKLFLSKVRK